VIFVSFFLSSYLNLISRVMGYPSWTWLTLVFSLIFLINFFFYFYLSLFSLLKSWPPLFFFYRVALTSQATHELSQPALSFRVVWVSLLDSQHGLDDLFFISFLFSLLSWDMCNKLKKNIICFECLSIIFLYFRKKKPFNFSFYHDMCIGL
jgi:hypothetical protein